MVILNYVRSNILVALFLSIAIGYAIGKIRFGKFQLGGIAGSLLVSVIIGQLGFHIPGILKTAFLHYLFMRVVIMEVLNSLVP